MKACVLGSPVSQSLSPAIFEHLSRKTGRVLEYTALETPLTQLPETLARLRAERDWVGANVTIPLKARALELADGQSPEARAVGAANVLKLQGDLLIAHNTDVLGIRKVLETHLASPAGGAVIAGTGGSARAAVIALRDFGYSRIAILSRDSARAAAFCRSFQDVPGLEAAGPSVTPALWINATPVGAIPAAMRAKLRLVFDFTYRPDPTPLVRESLENGCAAVTGLSMLVWQALATWQEWFGDDVVNSTNHDEARAALIPHLGAPA